MLKLFGSTTSPFVRHCRIALLQENIPFELVLTDYAGSAAKSPTRRVPFLEDEGLFLTDSSSILHHIRSKAGKRFLPTTDETELFCLANTALDTAINLFLLERDGLTDSPYIGRQKDRLVSCFEAMEQVEVDWDGHLDDAIIRMGVLMHWLSYRNRFDYSSYTSLCELSDKLRSNAHFVATEPPPA